MDFHKLLKTSQYDFLRTNEYLGGNIILLGLGGSYAYGTNHENSDIDIRGIALNSKTDLLGMSCFEQYTDEWTDTTIFSFRKMIKLLLECNPNTCELLGLRQKDYLYLSPIGKELLEHKKLFLSQRAIKSFGGYASQQLRRLQNALARDTYPQLEKEEHICASIKNTMADFNRRYHEFEKGGIKVYIDKAEHPKLEAEMYLDLTLQHYPLRDYKNIWSEMNNIIKDYEKVGKRNNKKDDNHLNKHAMHLIRLFMMAIDILEKEEIITYRSEERELLLQIRNGGFQKEDGMFREEFYEMLAEYEKRLESASRNTNLPKEPDYKKVEEFMMGVNKKVVCDEIEKLL